MVLVSFLSFYVIYPDELQPKYEHHGSYATFTDLDIAAVNDVCEYKLYVKRNNYPFFIAPMSV